MSFGQTYTPGALAPFFNSATPVVALSGAVALAGRGWASHVALGALAGPLAMAGYYATATLRGFAASPSWVVLWCVAGLVAGSAMGAAAWALRGHGPWPMRGLAAAVFPAVALGEALHGLVRISTSTPVAYWWTQALVGVAVLAWLAGTRLRGARERAVAVFATAVLAPALFLIYGAV